MLSLDLDDTIAAIASPAGNGLRGVIRISGPNCLACLERAFQFPTGNPFSNEESGSSHQSKSRRPFQLAAAIDLSPNNANAPIRLSGQLLIWPSTQSYTRQPSAEFHTIGSAPLLHKALARICESGSRIAQPGEFTLRAFLSGRLDLPQAEAVLSIIDAQAEQQLSVALRQLAGGLSGPLMQVREQLMWILAELEAGLDFAEEDIQFISHLELVNRLMAIELQLHEIASQMKSRGRTSQSIRVALVGLPNSGKSTIFNELLGSNRAIVSHESGTTTDFLSVQLDLGGIEVELTDTAGLEAFDEISDHSLPAVQAQRFRKEIESQTAIRLLCVDSSVLPSKWDLKEISAIDSETANDPITILVLTKNDLSTGSQFLDFISPTLRAKLEQKRKLVQTQVPSLNQQNDLRLAIRCQVINLMEAHSEVVASTLVRTETSLRSVIERIQVAVQCATNCAGEELVAAEIRNALDELGLITGTVYTDDILDLVFSRFCIGK